MKSSSPLSKQMPFDGDLLLLSSSNADFDSSSAIHLNMSPNEYVFSPVSFHQTSTNDLPSEISLDDIKIFQKTHDDYSTKLYQAFIKFQFDFIEKIIQQFWILTNIHYSQTNELTTNGIFLFFVCID